MWIARDLECDDESAGRTIGQLKECFVAIKTGKAGLSVREAQAFSSARFQSSITLDAGAVILYLYANYAVPRRGSDLNMPGSRVSNRMTHGVLDDGLED